MNHPLEDLTFTECESNTSHAYTSKTSLSERAYSISGEEEECIKLAVREYYPELCHVSFLFPNRHSFNIEGTSGCVTISFECEVAAFVAKGRKIKENVAEARAFHFAFPGTPLPKGLT